MGNLLVCLASSLPKSLFNLSTASSLPKSFVLIKWILQPLALSPTDPVKGLCRQQLVWQAVLWPTNWSAALAPSGAKVASSSQGAAQREEGGEEEWDREDAAASIVQQANARLAANDAMLYIFCTVHPPVRSSIRPSVCPSVGLFVQLRLLRGDKNDLATCTFGHGRLLHAPSKAQLKLQMELGLGMDRERGRQSWSRWRDNSVAAGKYLDRFDFSC